MEVSESTPRRAATIEGLTVQIPAPYVEGHVCSAAEASMLNQTTRENFGNNLRSRIKAFVPEGSPEGTEPRPATQDEAQALVDAYATSYVPGVRRSGGGGGRASLTPVEQEVRAIAKQKVKELLKQRSLKQSEVDFSGLVEQAIERHGEALTRMAEKIVAQREKATAGSDDMLASIAEGLPGA